MANNKKYVVGDTITLADLSLFPVICCSVALGLDLTKYPHISTWYDHMKVRDSVQKCSPTEFYKQLSSNPDKLALKD